MSTTTDVPNGTTADSNPPVAGEQEENNRETAKISADEIALYDRQIRLWGVEAQENLRNSKILLVTIRGLANEVAKNLVLAGIGSLTLVDHEDVTEEDRGAQFLLCEATTGEKRSEAAAKELQKLNPRVAIKALTQDIRTVDETFYHGYDIIIATDLDMTTASTVNAGARLSNLPTYVAGVHGLYGYIFADLLDHHYVVERQKSNVPIAVGDIETATRSIVAISSKHDNGKTVELVTKRETYSPLLLANTSPLSPELSMNMRKLAKVTPLLSCLRALWEFQQQMERLPTLDVTDVNAFTALVSQKHIELLLPLQTLTPEFMQTFLQNVGSELAPVTAFLGGQLAQEAINLLSKREQPLQNLLVFDGNTFKAPIYAFHPSSFVATQPMLPIPMSTDGFDGSIDPTGLSLPMGPTAIDPAVMAGALFDPNDPALVAAFATAQIPLDPTTGALDPSTGALDSMAGNPDLAAGNVPPADGQPTGSQPPAKP